MSFVNLGLIRTTALLALAVVDARAQGARARCALEQTNYRGWNALKLSNGGVSLFITPDIGGRVIQFQLGDHPFFFVNPALAGKVFPPAENGGDQGGWKNYGGDKLWPAPQGWESDDEWPGPPDPVLDGGKYTSEILETNAEHVAVKLTSPPDARTGVQLGRTIHLYADGTQVRVDCTMKNISRRPVRWAIWEVIQQDTADPGDPSRFNHNFRAYCPLNSRSYHPRGFSPLFGQANHPSFKPDYGTGLLTVKYDYRVGKVGLDSDAGWFAAVNGCSDHCFVGKFTFFPQATYPDHASVEFWLNGAGEFIINGNAITNAADPKETPYLMETEILSPLVTLQPGEDYRFRVDWFATRCPAPVIGVTSAGAVSRKLRAEVADGQVRLEGIFGVFYRGRVEAVFKTSDGRAVGHADLGPVQPDQRVRLARTLPLPQGTFRVSVRLLDQAGEDRGSLGNATVSGGE